MRFKIDCTKIDEQIAYNQTKVQEIIDIKVKIYTYSRKYEETKAQNFYKKNIETKLKSEPAEAIMDSIVNFLPFQRNVLYIGHPVVIQIFQDGFLADFAPGEYQYQSVIFVQDKDSRKLLAGDYFDPFLPIKFTGRHFTYTNIYGERRVVPIFNVCLSTAKSQVLPQIKDTFYFVKKPRALHSKQKLESGFLLVNIKNKISNATITNAIGTNKPTKHVISSNILQKTGAQPPLLPLEYCIFPQFLQMYLAIINISFYFHFE
jgi:hypothetical protein